MKKGTYAKYDFLYESDLLAVTGRTTTTHEISFCLLEVLHEASEHALDLGVSECAIGYDQPFNGRVMCSQSRPDTRSLPASGRANYPIRFEDSRPFPSVGFHEPVGSFDFRVRLDSFEA
jgi:hypothetical protein